MLRNNRKGIIAAYVYLIFLGVTIIVSGMIGGTILLKHFSAEILNKTKSFYSAESGIEEGLLAFKKDPEIDNFIPNDAILFEGLNKRNVEYREQKIYKKELMIKELIPAGKSIQLPFAKKDLDSRITQFHIGLMQYDKDEKPTSNVFCNTPSYDSGLEISALQRAKILTTEPLDYIVELNSNWNGCYIGNNSVGKTSLITYSDPYSNEKVSLIGDKCIMNSKGNVTGSIFELDIPYKLNDRGDTDPENNVCELDCGGGGCSDYYTYNADIKKGIQGYQKFYTIAPNFVWSDMSNDGLIMFNLRAIDEDAYVVIWATDDVGNPYEIPGRYINFSALGIAQGGDLNEGLFTRLKLKKKSNNDLLPVFDFSLFTESEFIK